ncbi:MAG: SulP family inorganic anion transporter [Deinococcota bacterium]
MRTEQLPAYKLPSLNNLRADLAGGLAATIIGLPKNIVYGLIAFAPLGPTYASIGVTAGFFSAIFAGFMAALLGSTPSLISAPSPAAALVASSLMAQLFMPGFSRVGAELDPASFTSIVVTVAFLVMFLTGLLQVGFGFFRAGNLIKFIPYPVIGGLLNGLALTVLLDQIPDLLGLESFTSGFANFQPLKLIIGVTTALLMWYGSRITTRVPDALLALLGGSLLYYLAVAVGLGGAVGDRLGFVSPGVPQNYLASFFSVLRLEGMLELFPTLLSASFSTALLISTKTLLVALSLQTLTNHRTNVNRELIAQGFANMSAASVGGLAVEGSFSQSAASHRAGATSRLSGMMWGLFTLIIAYFLGTLVGLVPNIVMTGILIIVAFSLADPWSLRLLRDFFTGKIRQRGSLWGDIIVILLVTGVTLVADLVTAVTVGLVLSVLLYVFKMSKATIRRNYDAVMQHSSKQRDDQSLEALSENGAQLGVVELEGFISFASADTIVNQVEALAEAGKQYLILDLTRVNDMDITSARLVEQLNRRLANDGKELALSGVARSSQLGQFLETTGIIDSFDDDHLFEDTDVALACFEDKLLQDTLPQYLFKVLADNPKWLYLSNLKKSRQADMDDDEIALEDITVLQGMSEDDMAILNSFMHRERFSAGDAIFQEGDAGSAVFFIAKGLVDVSKGGERIGSFAAGTFFGETALLDARSKRTATVTVTEDAVFYRLSAMDFQIIKQTAPNMTVTLLSNIGRTLTAKMRYARGVVTV